LNRRIHIPGTDLILEGPDQLAHFYPQIVEAGGELTWSKNVHASPRNYHRLGVKKQEMWDARGWHLFLQFGNSGERVCTCNSSGWSWRDPHRDELVTFCQSGGELYNAAVLKR
jgi:hypothetical protein